MLPFHVAWGSLKHSGYVPGVGIPRSGRSWITFSWPSVRVVVASRPLGSQARLDSTWGNVYTHSQWKGAKVAWESMRGGSMVMALFSKWNLPHSLTKIMWRIPFRAESMRSNQRLQMSPQAYWCNVPVQLLNGILNSVFKRLCKWPGSSFSCDPFLSVRGFFFILYTLVHRAKHLESSPVFLGRKVVPFSLY